MIFLTLSIFTVKLINKEGCTNTANLLPNALKNTHVYKGSIFQGTVVGTLLPTETANPITFAGSEEAVTLLPRGC